jgi:hypothetical protein
VLVHWNDIDLIISGENIHQREDFTSGTIVDDLVDERGRKVVFRTCFVNIPIINAHMDCALFLVNQDNIGNPVSESHWVNKVGFEKFHDFKLDSGRFTWVDRTKALPNGFRVWVCLNLMYHNVWVNTQHFFIAPGEEVTKLFEKRLVGDNFVRGTRSSDMHIFDNYRFYGYVKGDGG